MNFQIKNNGIGDRVYADSIASYISIQPVNSDLKSSHVMNTFSIFSEKQIIAKAQTLSDNIFSTWISDINITPHGRSIGANKILLKLIDDHFADTAIFVNATMSLVPEFLEIGFVVKHQLICCARMRKNYCLENLNSYSNNQNGKEKSKMAKERSNIRFENTTDHINKKALADLYVSVDFGKHENYDDLDDMVGGMFGPGVFGFFAFENDILIGLARVYSDDYSVAWIAEICINPEWQKKGIGSSLLNIINNRFQHTDLYAQPFTGQEDFFIKGGIPARSQLAVCGRASIS